MSNHTDLLIAALCIVAAVAIGVAGILIDRPEKPRKTAAPGQHSRRGQRRAARAAEDAEDEKTVAWVAYLRRPPVRALAVARARVAGLLAVLPDRPGPRCGRPGCGRPLTAGCRHITPAHITGWDTAPGPWDTDEARAELVPLPPMPVDLARLAGEYADLFGHGAPHPCADVASCVFCGHMGPVKAHHGGDLVCADDDACQARGVRQLPAAELTVVDLVVVDPPPNARAGYWQPRAELPAGPPHFFDWDPAVDDAGLIHLRYPWADQVAADFDWAPVSRG